MCAVLATDRERRVASLQQLSLLFDDSCYGVMAVGLHRATATAPEVCPEGAVLTG